MVVVSEEASWGGGGKAADSERGEKREKGKPQDAQGKRNEKAKVLEKPLREPQSGATANGQIKIFKKGNHEVGGRREGKGNATGANKKRR